MASLSTKFEQGTSLVVDGESITLKGGYTDTGTLIERKGDVVFLAFHFTATAREAWAEKSKYKLGDVVTEGGKTYTLIKLEPEAEKSKPTTDAGVHWQEIVAPLVLCTLPVPFRPAAEVSALKTGTPTVKIHTDGTVNLSAAEADDAFVFYKAASVSP